MSAVKIVAFVLLAYLGLVAVFESLIGVLQPSNESTLVITTFEPDGTAHERVVSRLESDGQLYVAANHWPRAWYERALASPDVEVTLDGETRALRAVPVTGAEHARIDDEHALGPFFRFLTGFPPRHFLRLEPR